MTGRRAPLLLVVGDDETQRSFYRQALEPAGFVVAEAESGDAALALLERVRPDAILLDVMMAGIDGFTTCAAIRGIPGGGDTPVLMVTGADDVASIDAAFDAGATDFVSKPINRTRLVQRMRYMLRGSEVGSRLRVSERRLAEAQRIAAVGNFLWRPQGGAIECSAEVSRILGVSTDADAMPVKTILKRVPWADRKRLMRTVKSAFANDEFLSIDHVVRRDGEPDRHVSVRAEVTQGDHGLPCFQGTLQDITDRKRIEHELELARDEAQSADAAKTAFLAAITHELRTPLNIIIGFSECIATEIIGPVDARYRDYAKDILNSGTHMLDIVNAIITITRLEARSFDMTPEPIDLHAAAETAVAAFRVSDIGRNRAVTIAAAKAGASVLADKKAVQQMLLHLLSNAAKFSPPEAAITVTIARSGGFLRLTVSDHGIGMSDREIELAVQPFRQADERLARRYDGVGLGLSIVKKLIEVHGGTLVIESVPRIGSSISLDFPIDPACSPSVPMVA
jgi:signal transduction histidine kinase